MTDFYSLTEELGGMTEVAMYEARRLFLRGGFGYYEFGLFKGYNLWRAWQTGQAVSQDIKYYGFDSFEGLPANDVPDDNWHTGAYAASVNEVEQHLVDRSVDVWGRVQLYKGWFSTEHFDEISARETFRPAGVVVVDSDLYESAVPVLTFISSLLVDGTVILFDDWMVPWKGEREAWEEFNEREQWIYDECDFGRFGHKIVLRGKRDSSNSDS